MVMWRWKKNTVFEKKKKNPAVVFSLFCFVVVVVPLFTWLCSVLVTFQHINESIIMGPHAALLYLIYPLK